MSHTIRRIIFWSFVLIFCVTTVILSLQAEGYRLNLKYPFSLNHVLQKTGMLIVESSPKGAKISLDEKAIKKIAIHSLKKVTAVTPAKINNLLPGKYNLTLEMEGYWPIQKNIEIKSGQTTVINDVNLFRKDLPWLLQSSSDGIFSLSPDGAHILIGSDGSWKLVDTASQTSQELESTASSSRFSWIDNGSKLLLGAKLYDLKKEQGNTNFSSVIGDASALCYQSGKQKLFYVYDDNLNCLNTSNLSSQIITSGNNIQNVVATGNYIIIITDDNKMSKLKILDYDGKTLKTVDIPFSDYSLAVDSSGWLDLYDTDKKSLYILDPSASGKPLIKSMSYVSSWQWIKGGQLLYATDFEIHLADIKSGSDDILIRIGDKINGAFKKEDSNFVIYAAGNSLRALEMTGQNISIELFKGENIKLFGLDQGNSIAYFFTKIGQQEGVYEMKIK